MPFDTKAHKFETKLMESGDPKYFPSMVLGRKNEKVQEIEFTLQIQGIYSLPDAWKAKIVSFKFVFKLLMIIGGPCRINLPIRNKILGNLDQVREGSSTVTN